jgi:selenocysteine lyase/cysteine desulfurase
VQEEEFFQIQFDLKPDALRALNDLLYDGLKERNVQIVTPMGANERSGIFSFIPSTDPKSLYAFLSKEMIRVSLRNNMIRLSPHFYNNKHDIDRFFRALDSY